MFGGRFPKMQRTMFGGRFPNMQKTLYGLLVVGAVLALGLAALTFSPDKADAGVPADLRQQVRANLFSGPPDHSAVRRDAASKAPEAQKHAIVNGRVTRDAYLSKAKDAARCVESRTGAKATEPVLKDGRAVWTLDAGAPRLGTPDAPPPPDPAVNVAMRECQEEHVAQVERLWLAQELPQGDVWKRERASLIRCLGVADDASRVASAIYAEMTSGLREKPCLDAHRTLFDIL